MNNVMTQSKDVHGDGTKHITAVRPYISGTEVVGITLHGHYTYCSCAALNESGTSLRWLRADSKKGEYLDIFGQVGNSYTLTPQDAGKYIRIEVTPKAGAVLGEPQCSVEIGPVLTKEQFAQIRNLYPNNKSYESNLAFIRSTLNKRLENAVYFTVDSGDFHGSNILYVNNQQYTFDDTTKPIKHDDKVYVTADFFSSFLSCQPPEMDTVQLKNVRYYPLKKVLAILGKEHWSGDECQSTVEHFLMKHLGEGLIVISETKNIFAPVPDRDLINEACNGLYSLRSSAEQMQWFRDAKYGLFLHFDPASQLKVEISWARKALRPFDSDNGFRNPIDPEYDTQYKTFLPTKLNTDDWMYFAQKSGMKYAVYTSKHHASFSTFFTDYDNYNVANTPYNHDIVADYVASTKKFGIKTGIYYSIRDWFHPNYLTKDHHRYLAYLFGELQELLINYGTIDLLWFDSIGQSTFNQWDLRTLLRRIKQINPDIIVNNRFAAIRQAKSIPDELRGDWDTPEQRMGHFQDNRPWESCMTILESPEKGGGWSYREDCGVRTLQESVQYLVGNAVNDGNLLYNIGPMPNGTLNESQAQVLLEVGKWLKPYAPSICNTRGGPYKNKKWGGSTHHNNDDGTQTIYLHISPLLHSSFFKTLANKFSFLPSPLPYSPKGNTLQISLPQNGQVYHQAKLLSNGKKVILKHNARGLLLKLPQGESWDALDTVIELIPDCV